MAIRVKVENVIRRLKVFRILGERYRNRRRGYAIKVNIIAGIVNPLMGFRANAGRGATRSPQTAFKNGLSQRVHFRSALDFATNLHY